jgi:hypothetical protein
MEKLHQLLLPYFQYFLVRILKCNFSCRKSGSQGTGKVGGTNVKPPEVV